MISFLAGILLLTGCAKEGSEPATAKPTEEPEEVMLVVWCDEAELADFQEKAAAAAEAHPDWSVIIQSESLDTVTDTVLTDPAMAADLFEYPEHDASMLMEAGALPHREDGIYGYPVKEKDGVLIGLNANCTHAEEAETLGRILSGLGE